MKFLIESPDLHDPDEARKLLGIGQNTFWRWVKAGKIIPSRINMGSGPSRLVIPQSEIDRILNAKNGDRDA